MVGPTRRRELDRDAGGGADCLVASLHGSPGGVYPPGDGVAACITAEAHGACRAFPAASGSAHLQDTFAVSTLQERRLPISRALPPRQISTCRTDCANRSC